MPTLDEARFEFCVVPFYCSVLDDCGQADATRADLAPVAECPLIAESERWQG